MLHLGAATRPGAERARTCPAPARWRRDVAAGSRGPVGRTGLAGQGRLGRRSRRSRRGRRGRQVARQSRIRTLLARPGRRPLAVDGRRLLPVRRVAVALALAVRGCAGAYDGSSRTGCSAPAARAPRRRPGPGGRRPHPAASPCPWPPLRHRRAGWYGSCCWAAAIGSAGRRTSAITPRPLLRSSATPWRAARWLTTNSPIRSDAATSAAGGGVAQHVVGLLQRWATCPRPSSAISITAPEPAAPRRPPAPPRGGGT